MYSHFPKLRQRLSWPCLQGCEWTARGDGVPVRDAVMVHNLQIGGMQVQTSDNGKQWMHGLVYPEAKHCSKTGVAFIG